MEKSIFICYALYHSLIAMVKTITEDLNSDILIMKSKSRRQDEIFDKVKRSQVFENIYTISEDDAPLGEKKHIIRFLYNRCFRLKKYYYNNLKAYLIYYGGRS